MYLGVIKTLRIVSDSKIKEDYSEELFGMGFLKDPYDTWNNAGGAQLSYDGMSGDFYEAEAFLREKYQTAEFKYSERENEEEAEDTYVIENLTVRL